MGGNFSAQFVDYLPCRTPFIPVLQVANSCLDSSYVVSAPFRRGPSHFPNVNQFMQTLGTVACNLSLGERVKRVEIVFRNRHARRLCNALRF